MLDRQGSHARRLGHCIVALALALPIAPVLAQRFVVGPTTIEVLGPTAFRGNMRTFLDVYCVELPQPERIRSFSEGLLGDNGAISYYRAHYPDERLSAYIVTSTLPDDLDEHSDFDAQVRRERQNAANVNAASGTERYRVRVRPGHPQPVVEVAIANIGEDDGNTPFPIARSLYVEVDTPPHTRSAHRLFARGRNRYEVATLGVPAAPDAAGFAALERRLDELADQLTRSIQQCDVTRHAATPRTTNEPGQRTP